MEAGEEQALLDVELRQGRRGRAGGGGVGWGGEQRRSRRTHARLPRAALPVCRTRPSCWTGAGTGETGAQRCDEREARRGRTPSRAAQPPGVCLAGPATRPPAPG
jgi:hypothetical protein